MVEKTRVSGVNAVILAATHLGEPDVDGIGLELIEIPSGKHFYMTEIYGVAGLVGQIVIYDLALGYGTEAELDAATKLRLYISATGDGATGFCIGPFTSGVWVASDGVATTTDIADIVVAGYFE